MNAVRPRRRWPWILGGLVLVGVAFGALATRARGSKGSVVDPTLVVKLGRGDLEISVVEIGKIEPREKVAVKSKVAGQALKILVDEGHKVKKGQLLMQLDPLDYQRAATRAQQEVERAQAAVELAQITLDRRKRALADRGVTQADVEVAENDLKQKRIAVATAREVYATARDQLVYTRITAPLDGTITQRNIQPGETVVPGVAATFDDRSLLTVSDLSVLLAKAELNQIDVAKVQLGQAVTLTLDALPGKTFKAKVTKIAPASVLPKGKDVEVFPIEATLEPDGIEVIKPGMTADVKVHVETKKGVLRLPIEAVVKDKGKAYVLRVTDDPAGGGKVRTTRVEVKVGARNDRDQEIVSGLAEGERVLIKPASADANEWK
ncbi:MAG TPA: efflux RND transporter periplasmic adaptor subunit [Polyangia bacterium]|jgi:HlyD family secretion protein/macrolide-specific efflux system membrane fusion protein